ncbi:DUF6614 family protein [Marimonas arenosa]|uniref:Uncharacterized protein n=1 Tax=Marimonas arenosa TaxID=1795305 RepID=A0AAE4B4Z6_9RHOB|nr:DUF6614 family protein [Marimonas arenosa]MDQ2088671.1 hypothetical protein [Marimonas arenosa]
MVLDRQLLQCQPGFADTPYRDVLLEIAVKDLAKLHKAFRVSGQEDETVSTYRRNLHTP